MLSLNITYAIKYIKNRDALKSMLFFNSRSKLDDSVKQHKPIVLNNTTCKVKKIIAGKNDDEPIFDINDIDKLSYNELKQLLDTINRVDSFEFEQPVIEEEKVKKLELEQK